MNLVVTVLEIVAPVFLIAGLGFGWVRAGFEYRMQFVTRLGVTVAVPCLIFVSLMQAQVEPGALAAMSMAAVAAHLVICAGVFAFLRLRGLDLRTYLAPLTFGNTGNLGLPLSLFAFGQQGLELAIVVLAVSSLLSFTFGIWFVAGKGSAGRLWREPMIWATILGALFLWQGWETPRFLTNTISMIGQMAIPLMLLTLGVAVGRLGAQGVGRAFVLSLVKLAICVPLAWGVGMAFGLGHTSFGVLVLQMSTPVAVTAYLLAEKYGADSTTVAGLAVTSTLVSVAALPLLLGVLL